MQRWIPILSTALGVQLLLAGALALRHDDLSAATPDTPLVTAAIKDADHLVIEAATDTTATDKSSSSQRVELSKKNDKWVIDNYFNAPANAGKLDGLLGQLARLKRGLPVGTSKAALRRFKVVDDNFERRVVLSKAGKTLTTLYFGASPGLRQSDARSADDDAVYAVDMPTYELPASAKEWFDGDVLNRKADTLAEIDITHHDHDAKHGNAANTLTLTKLTASDQQSAQWQVQGLAANQQIDAQHADTLASSIANVHVDAVLGDQAKPANPEWRQDQPLLTLKLKDKQGVMTIWTMSKPSSGDFEVLKSSAQPWYFSLTDREAKSLLDNSSAAALVAQAKPASDKSTRQAQQNSPQQSPHISRSAG
jgi:hypothetical protein